MSPGKSARRPGWGPRHGAVTQTTELESVAPAVQELAAQRLVVAAREREASSIGRLAVCARDAAAMFGLAERTWWRLHASGLVPAPQRCGGSVRWITRELEEWAAAGMPVREVWLAMRVGKSASQRTS